MVDRSDFVDSALVAIVGCGSHMKVRRLLALKQFSRYDDDIVRLDYLSGAIDDSIVSAVSSDQHFFPSREQGRQLKGVSVTFAWIRTQEYRPKFGEGLGARKGR